jgi:hypothetical protein
MEKANDAEAGYNALGTLLSRWPARRSEDPETEAVNLFREGPRPMCTIGRS